MNTTLIPYLSQDFNLGHFSTSFGCLLRITFQAGGLSKSHCFDTPFLSLLKQISCSKDSGAIYPEFLCLILISGDANRAIEIRACRSLAGRKAQAQLGLSTSSIREDPDFFT